MGGLGSFVPVSLQIAILSVLAVMVVVMAFFLWRVARRPLTGVVVAPAPTAAAVDPLGTDALLAALSGRLAAVEGRVGSLAASLEGVAVLIQRVATLETNMPSVQDAMEKYADSIARLDKRNLERDRRAGMADEKAADQTAGQAAADVVGAAGVGGNSDSPPAQPAAPNPRLGVVGSGGRGRHRRGT